VCESFVLATGRFFGRGARPSSLETVVRTDGMDLRFLALSADSHFRGWPPTPPLISADKPALSCAMRTRMTRLAFAGPDKTYRLWSTESFTLFCKSGDADHPLPRGRIRCHSRTPVRNTISAFRWQFPFFYHVLFLRSSARQRTSLALGVESSSLMHL